MVSEPIEVGGLIFEEHKRDPGWGTYWTARDAYVSVTKWQLDSGQIPGLVEEVPLALVILARYTKGLEDQLRALGTRLAEEPSLSV